MNYFSSLNVRFMRIVFAEKGDNLRKRKRVKNIYNFLSPKSNLLSRNELLVIT